MKYKQVEKHSIESCGILIGTHSLDGKKIEIHHITEPSSNDIRKKYFFKMNSQFHQKKLNKIFIESGDECVYLGTWHTHPEKIPMPSKCDINDWKKQYKENNKMFDKMCFMIIGQTSKIIWMINDSGIIKLPRENIIYE